MAYATERAIVTQNVKVVMARIGDPAELTHADLLWGFRNEAQDKAAWEAHYLAIFADVIVEDYLRGKLGVNSTVYAHHLLGTKDPVQDEVAWRVQDDLENYINAALKKGQSNDPIFEKVVGSGPEYAGLFALAAVRSYFAIVRRTNGSAV